MDFEFNEFIYQKGWTEVCEALMSSKSCSANSSQLATKIKELSDIYIAGAGSEKIWKDPGLAEAYLSYFLPLNSVRLNHAWQQFGANLMPVEAIYELGSGPGTAQISLSGQFNAPWICDEKSPEAKKIHHALCEKLNLAEPQFQNIQSCKPNSLGLFSYVLTETTLPQWAYDCEHLFIIEASMREASRNLMKLREELVQKGYNILAPCTHNHSCPLLQHTKKDFCHFRTHFKAYPEFEKLEELLPMKNSSLTYSFLLVSKSKALKSTDENSGRVIGEALIEKGKIRQPFCRSSEKEQLSWLRRGKSKVELPSSGSLYELPSEAQKKGFELRIPSE